MNATKQELNYINLRAVSCGRPWWTAEQLCKTLWHSKSAPMQFFM
jgi:hypothetical protein